MFKVLKFDLLIKYITTTTVIISTGVYATIRTAWLPNLELFKVITISTIVSALIIFALLSPQLSRKIWAIWSIFNKSLFPDLNGTWEGEITLENGNTLITRAVIRQSLLTTQIDMHGETTKSITLEATPTIEQGQRKLYYTYRSSPKNPQWPSYNGTTLLDVRKTNQNKSTRLELTGYYYTDRKTLGRIRLCQISHDANNDVSFY